MKKHVQRVNACTFLNSLPSAKVLVWGVSRILGAQAPCPLSLPPGSVPWYVPFHQCLTATLTFVKHPGRDVTSCNRNKHLLSGDTLQNCEGWRNLLLMSAYSNGSVNDGRSNQRLDETKIRPKECLNDETTQEKRMNNITYKSRLIQILPAYETFTRQSIVYYV